LNSSGTSSEGGTKGGSTSSSFFFLGSASGLSSASDSGASELFLGSDVLGLFPYCFSSVSSLGAGSYSLSGTPSLSFSGREC